MTNRTSSTPGTRVAVPPAEVRALAGRLRATASTLGSQVAAVDEVVRVSVRALDGDVGSDVAAAWDVLHRSLRQVLAGFTHYAAGLSSLAERTTELDAMLLAAPVLGR